MTSDVRQRLLSRTSHHQIALVDAELDRLEVYFRLLTEWDRRINLTGFDLDLPTDHAIDRLICEPLAGAKYFPQFVACWIDIGSGGGSPAVPIKIVRPDLPLTMVEMRARKAAFLREVSRELDLVETDVREARFQDWAGEPSQLHSVEIVTIRAVRSDSSMIEAVSHVLRPDGAVLVFGSAQQLDWAGFSTRTVSLLSTDEVGSSILSICSRASDVSRGTLVEKH